MKYRPLKDFVAKHGGLRLSMHPRLREQLVDMAVEEFPFDASDAAAVEVLTARLTVRARKQYGSILVLVFITAAGAIVAKLIWEWLRKRHAHRVLLMGWQEAAKKGR